MQNLTKEWKQPPVVILQKAFFYNILMLCFWLRFSIMKRCAERIGELDVKVERIAELKTANEQTFIEVVINNEK